MKNAQPKTDAHDEPSDAPAEGGQKGAPPPAARPAGETMGWFELLRDLYGTFDRRTLGFTRILLGFLLIMDLIHRSSAWMDMYSTEGVLPNHLNLFRPQAWGNFTIFNAFSTPGELAVLWVLMFAIGVCLLVGYKTKVAQVLALVFVASMNGRVLLIENGGYVVNNLLFMWTAFLPLGDRFSVEAMLDSMRRRRETTEEELNDRSDQVAPEKRAPHVTLLGPVLFIQLSAIYFFNVVHKTGPAWKNGTAVHYVLYVDRMAMPLIALIRDYVPNWAILFMTKSALAFEAAIPVALLMPLARVWARRIAIFMINTLHIAFGTTFVLGPFAWSCCTFSTLLFSSADWDLAYRTMRRPHRARVVLYDRRSPGALLFCRILKRLDNFELLVFRAASDVPLGVALQAEDGGVITRSAAFADMIAALPLGPLFAWPLRAPVLRGVFDALFAALEARDLSRFFGMHPAPSFTAPEPSRISRGLRWMRVGLRELAILTMFAGALNQAAVELWVINRRVKVPQPEPLRLLSHKLRYLQGWFMFSPNPVMDDGSIVVDAVTVDGRHIDPFTRKEPNFDLIHAKSLGLTQIWCDYFNRIQLPGNTGYRDAMKEYMYRLPERTGNPNDAIVSGEVFWIKDMNPRWNEKESYRFEKVSLFSFQNPAAQAQVRANAPPAE